MNQGNLTLKSNPKEEILRCKRLFQYARTRHLMFHILKQFQYDVQ
jgi:hypothetical protein